MRKPRSRLGRVEKVHAAAEQLYEAALEKFRDAAIAGKKGQDLISYAEGLAAAVRAENLAYWEMEKAHREALDD